MNRPAWILLLLVWLGVAVVPCAQAIYRFDVRVEDMVVIDCWDPNTCAPITASITLVNDDNESERHVIPCAITTGGSPLTYQFVADADSLVDDCEGDATYTIVERRARFCGPGFGHLVSRTNTIPYPCSLPFPQRIIPTDDTGCDVSCGQPYWTCYSWEVHPSGVVTLLDDLIELVLHPSTRDLCIDPGMRLHFQPGKRLIVAGPGELRIQGTAEAPITLAGEDWGGMELRDGARLELRHVRITGVSSEGDGGALEVGPGSEARLFHCVVDHNACAGAGGAAVVRENGLLFLDHCTMADNSGGPAGGVFLAAASAQFESNMSILAFSSPEGTELTGTGFAHVPFSDIFPQISGFPPAMEAPSWTCEPGFVNRAAGDYHLTWLTPSDSSQVNCVLDVWDDPLQLDPDGTPGDMGAFPFDQYQVMHPATILAVTDRPNDQGGYVLVEFLASPNDGSWINPTTLYSVWVRYPGMSGEQWVSAGTVAALADPAMQYVVSVATLDDQFEGNENVHEFMIGTHSVDFPTPVASAVLTGFSVDNLAPEPVESVDLGEWEYDQWPPTQDLLTITWSPSAANDLSHYQVLASLTDDINTAPLLYSGPATTTQFHSPFGTMDENDDLYVWVHAVDTHMNVSSPTTAGGFHYLGVDERLPFVFELSQNIPNPFNPTTSVPYALPQAGPVRLVVYNMQGQVVTTLVDEAKTAGRHSVQFDGSGLASGVYIYRLETPGQSVERKLLLLK